jgi:hypothetical protein
VPDRTYWLAKDFIIKDEPLMKSLLEYRQRENRFPVVDTDEQLEPNLISSITRDGKQMPILDLDFPHHIEPSTTPGHSHLYLDVKMSKLQWAILMWALYNAGVVELGFFVWSIRRGGNFVRIPGTSKGTDPRENTKPRYGWFFKLRESR